MNLSILLNSEPDLITGKGASEEQIEKAEEALKVSFANDYKEYLRVCGAIMVNGHELTGISKAEHMDVVNVTREGRKYDLPEDTEKMYVIEDLGIDGILIWQDSEGKIYEIQNGRKKKIGESLEEYLKEILE